MSLNLILLIFFRHLQRYGQCGCS